MLKAGQAAPTFVLPDADMELVDLAQYVGKHNLIPSSTRRTIRRTAR